MVTLPSNLNKISMAAVQCVGCKFGPGRWRIVVSCNGAEVWPETRVCSPSFEEAMHVISKTAAHFAAPDKPANGQSES